MVVLGLCVAAVLLGGVFAFRAAFQDAVGKHDRDQAEQRVVALREAIDFQIRERIGELESYDPGAILTDLRLQTAQAARARGVDGSEDEPLEDAIPNGSPAPAEGRPQPLEAFPPGVPLGARQRAPQSDPPRSPLSRGRAGSRAMFFESRKKVGRHLRPRTPNGTRSVRGREHRGRGQRCGWTVARRCTW
ncbi:MAG: hypothetical protein H6834_16190 [Planctomycetes bacterium]|nr:hypothetical protein [Planctomycetota bacterium]